MARENIDQQLNVYRGLGIESQELFQAIKGFADNLGNQEIKDAENAAANLIRQINSGKYGVSDSAERMIIRHINEILDNRRRQTNIVVFPSTGKRLRF